MFVPVSSKDLNFQRRGLFMINELKLEVIVRFVDINRIVDHRLSFMIRVRIKVMVLSATFNNISGLLFDNHISKHRSRLSPNNLVL